MRGTNVCETAAATIIAELNENRVGCCQADEGEKGERTLLQTRYTYASQQTHTSIYI